LNPPLNIGASLLSSAALEEDPGIVGRDLLEAGRHAQ
jgi:hypothetical protein